MHESLTVEPPAGGWTLDELVELANSLLPRFLPADIADARLRGQVNPRLVRHLTTLGLIRDPEREGREARYHGPHLLELLAVRRLLAEGHSTSSCRRLLKGAEMEDLVHIIESGSQSLRGCGFDGRQSRTAGERPPPAPPGAASSPLEFLQRVRERSTVGQVAHFMAPSASVHPGPRAAAASPASGVNSPTGQLWARLSPRPGLEIYISEEFQPPTTAHEKEALCRELQAQLQDVTGLFRSKKRK